MTGRRPDQWPRSLIWLNVGSRWGGVALGLALTVALVLTVPLGFAKTRPALILTVALIIVDWIAERYSHLRLTPSDERGPIGIVSVMPMGRTIEIDVRVDRGPGELEVVLVAEDGYSESAWESLKNRGSFTTISLPWDRAHGRRKTITATLWSDRNRTKRLAQQGPSTYS